MFKDRIYFKGKESKMLRIDISFEKNGDRTFEVHDFGDKKQEEGPLLDSKLEQILNFKTDCILKISSPFYRCDNIYAKLKENNALEFPDQL